jgi:uncharacterized protein DUF6526
MKKQNFKNHPRLTFGFHIVTFAVILAALIISINLLVKEGINLQPFSGF